MAYRLVGMVTAVLSLLPSAQAYQLGDHGVITRRAIEEYNLCTGNQVGPDLAGKMVSANEGEDTNLLRKWSKYSHFYHPKKTLADMSRVDSSLRMAMLEHSVEQLLARKTPEVEKAYLELAHAIHHLQDAASPPHVVPVMHGLTDRFESQGFSVDDLPDFDLDTSHCAKLAEAAGKDSLLKILDDAATATLETLKGPISASCDGVPATLTWGAFWKESSGDSFGEYGFLGNSFGLPTILVEGSTYRIDPQSYRELNRRQLRIAIDATRRALHWIAAKDWGT